MGKPNRVTRPWAVKSSSTRPYIQNNPNASRGGKDTQFYRRKAWLDTRALVLAKEPTCRNCRTNNKIVEATMVDHITPMKKGGAPYAFENLQPLCYKCHAIKSAKDK